MVTKRVIYYFTKDDDEDFKFLWNNGANVETICEYFGVSKGCVYNKRIELKLETYNDVQQKLSQKILKRLEERKKQIKNGDYQALFKDNGGRNLDAT